MPTSRTFTIALSPVTIGPGNFRMNNSLLTPTPDEYRTTIVAISVDELLAKIEAFAKPFGQAFWASVRFEGRKPTGYDAKTRGFGDLLFGLNAQEKALMGKS